jgi:hypothetical protein
VTATPLLYSPALAAATLKQYALGVFEPEDTDLVVFEPQGGVVQRELAIPFLPGMDSVVVERARLQLRSRPRDLEVEFDARPGSPGIIVQLRRPARLLSIAVEYAIPPAFATQTVRVVVRDVQLQNGSPAIGPPVYAQPGFGAPGPMFPPPLAGMSLTPTSTGAVLGFPRPIGQAWLIQLATGDDPVKLNAIDVSPTVRSVVVDAAPDNFSLALRLANESPQLWGHPDLFLPEVGLQEVDFSPLAQKRLAELLTEADAESTVTLSVALEFRSDGGGAVAIASRALDARYQVEALGTGAQVFRLGGDITALDLNAPAARHPTRIIADVTVRPLGRELNAGSHEPPVERPSHGLKVRPELLVAGAATFVAPDPLRLSLSPLVSIRVFVSSSSATEAVLDIRADVDGLPGEPIAPPVVRQFAAGFRGWAEFDLEKTWVPVAGSTTLWVSLRTNQGELLWFEATGGDESSTGGLVSLDRGASWGACSDTLAPPLALLIQLFHTVPDPQPAPSIRLHHGAELLAEDFLRAGGRALDRHGPREFVVEGSSLPSPVGRVLGAQPGTGKVVTRLSLFSRVVADVQFTRLTLEYDPFQSSAAGGG